MKMRTFLQNKLWRDKAVEKMEATGSRMQIRTLNDQEYAAQLKVKLLEEAEEVQSAENTIQLIEELADVFEVIDALCALHAIPIETIKEVQEKKREARGGFFQRKFVEKASHQEGSFGVQYCLADPQKYPEIIENDYTDDFSL